MMRPMTSRRRSLLCGTLLLVFLEVGCSENLEVQPSFQPQEAPRKHAPLGSVPQESRAILVSPPKKTAKQIQRGEALFEINCSHCHGKKGAGDGPVAKHIVVPPADLRSGDVQKKSDSELYRIVTDGRGRMPAFHGEISAEERWAIVYFVKSFGNVTEHRF